MFNFKVSSHVDTITIAVLLENDCVQSACFDSFNSMNYSKVTASTYNEDGNKVLFGHVAADSTKENIRY